MNSRKPVRDVGVTYFFNSCSERRSLGKSWIFKRFVLTLRNKLIAKDLLVLRFKPEFEDGGFERRYRRQLDIVSVDQPTLVQSLNQLGDLLSDDRLQHCIFGLSELWLPSQDILHHLSDGPRHEQLLRRLCVDNGWLADFLDGCWHDVWLVGLLSLQPLPRERPQARQWVS